MEKEKPISLEKGDVESDAVIRYDYRPLCLLWHVEIKRNRPKPKRGEDNDALPVLIQPDQEPILQTLEAGIDLVTTDKAILEMLPLYKRRYQEQNK